MKRFLLGCCLGPVILFLLLAALGGILMSRDKSSAQSGPAESEGQSAESAPREDLDDILRELDALVGLEGVKAEVRSLVNEVRIEEARRAQGIPVPKKSRHLVLTGNPGTGKTTVARLLARAFAALGVVKKGHLVETDRSGLVAAYSGQTAIKTGRLIDSAMDGILFIDEAYQLAGDGQDAYGKEAIATLIKRMDDDRDRLIVIAAGYTDEMRDFFEINPGLRSRFAKQIEFADYTPEELAQVFRSMAAKNKFRLSPGLDAMLDDAMRKLTKRRDRTFGNARFVRQLFEDAMGRQAQRLSTVSDLNADLLSTLEPSDLGMDEKKADARAPTIEEVLAELDGLTGMQPVKDEVRRLIATCQADRLRAEKGIDTGVTMSYNFVFTGNPGTGKTTVARILAKAFRALGILERGHLVETDRSGLVAAYSGQTALKTNRLIDSAKGGILFIDEAYQLNQGQNDQYGAEAVATLLKRMEDERGSMVIIIAGYKDEMKRFMAINSGLESRFNRTLFFPDFSAEELGQIFRSTARKNKYRLSADVEKYLDSYIRVMTKDRTAKFGNGRWARNLFEKAVERQALRVVGLKDPDADELLTLRMKDVGISLKDPNASDED